MMDKQELCGQQKNKVIVHLLRYSKHSLKLASNVSDLNCCRYRMNSYIQISAKSKHQSEAEGVGYGGGCNINHQGGSRLDTEALTAFCNFEPKLRVTVRK